MRITFLVPLLSDSFFEAIFIRFFVEPVSLPRRAVGGEIKIWDPPMKNPSYGPVVIVSLSAFNIIAAALRGCDLIELRTCLIDR